MDRIRTEIIPLKGKIVPIRTIQETRPDESFGDAYVAEINQKSAFQVNKVLQKSFPPDPDRSLNHLRRFVTFENLPKHLQEQIAAHRNRIDRSVEYLPTLYLLIPPPLPEVSELQTLLSPFAPVEASTKDKKEDNNRDEINQDGDEHAGTSKEPATPILIISTRIPLFPALTASQASTWTRTLWPVSFNPAAPRSFIAPPPAILKQAVHNIQPNAGFYLRLAQKLAKEAQLTGRGKPVGAVVVDPNLDVRIGGDGSDVDVRGLPQSSRSNSGRDGRGSGDDDWTRYVVAMAGDARYCAPGLDSVANDIPENRSNRGEEEPLAGGPEFHAVMRSIAIIAGQRVRDDDSVEDNKHLPPLTTLESEVLNAMDQQPQINTSESKSQSLLSAAEISTVSKPNSSHRIRSRSQGGYLCTDLDIYVSHEPCLSCCMGILLSRFRAVIFPRSGRMVSGGLVTEPVPETGADPKPTAFNAGGDGSQGDKKKLEEVDDGKDREKEPRPYYGLHWRKELNWRALGLEFVEDEEEHEEAVASNNEVNSNSLGRDLYASSLGLYHA